jgi:hypothetical protein
MEMIHEVGEELSGGEFATKGEGDGVKMRQGRPGKNRR